MNSTILKEFEKKKKNEYATDKKDGCFTNQHSVKPIKTYGMTKFGIASEFEEKN